MKHAFIVLSAALVMATPALAQEGGYRSESQYGFKRDRNTAVAARVAPDLAPQGGRAGTFLVYPKLETTLDRTSNVFATTTNRKSDTLLRAAPSVAVQSTWSRHALSLNAGLTSTRHQENDRENTTDWRLGASGRLDLTPGTQLSANLNSAKSTEPRTEPTANGAAAKPAQFDSRSANLTLSHEFNRLRLMAAYDYKDQAFGTVARIGGGQLDQSFRDYSTGQISLRADYAISPATAVFVSVERDERNYDRTLAGQKPKDSTGTDVAVGVSYEISNISRGEIQVGQIKRDYKSFRNTSSNSMKAKVEWFPSEMTTFTVNARRSVEETPDVTSSGYVSTSMGVAVDHELLQNFVISARADQTKDKYEGIVRDDTRQTFEAGGRYAFNRNVALDVRARSLDMNSKGKDRIPAFKVNNVMATLILQY